eukprot:579062-Amphidinium_carterae.1
MKRSDSATSLAGTAKLEVKEGCTMSDWSMVGTQLVIGSPSDTLEFASVPSGAANPSDAGHSGMGLPTVRTWHTSELYQANPGVNSFAASEDKDDDDRQWKSPAEYKSHDGGRGA